MQSAFALGAVFAHAPRSLDVVVVLVSSSSSVCSWLQKLR
jgi:hypothetical protein